MTLIGPGGSGKTRLAVQLGLDLVHDVTSTTLFADGVWLAELDAVGEPGLIPHVLASAVGVYEEPGRRLIDTIADALSARKLLVVLDNCEHLLAQSAAMVDMLLGRCPTLRVLATSRQPLALAGEVVRAVGPLELPPPDGEPTTLLESAAMQLFMERAQAASVDLEVTPEIAHEMATICRRLDGVPLALELAAARLRGLSMRDLAARLDSPFALLSSASHRPTRHQSLRSTIDWSYNLLSDPQRNLARALSVFSGGWTLEAAEAVCGSRAADGVVGLVDHSLVQFDWRSPDRPHYRMLETVRQFCSEQLVEAGEATAMRDAHLSYYLALAEAADSHLTGPEQVDWLHRLDLERGNLRSALQWAFTRPEREPAVRLTAALGSFWDIRGERSEGLERLEQALQSSADIDAQLQARLLRISRATCTGLGQQRAVGWLEQSLEASRDPSERLAALVQLGLVWIDEARVAQAIATLQEAVALAEELGDRTALAAALGALGQALLDNVDHAGAVRLLERSLDESRRLGDRIEQAGVLAQLAMARLETGDVANVRATLEEAQDLLLELGDAVGVAWTEHDLARLALEQGEFARAAALFDGSLRLFQAIGYRTASPSRPTDSAAPGWPWATMRPRSRCFEPGSSCLSSWVTNAAARGRCTTWPGLPGGAARSPLVGATWSRVCHSFARCRCRPGFPRVSPRPHISPCMTNPRKPHAGLG